MRNFRLQVRTVAVAVDVRRRFDRKAADALQNVGGRRERAECDLRRVVRVLNVLNGLVEAVNLRLQVRGNRKARRVI
jgi:uncharacterized protein (UPF0210 family)